MAIMNKPLIGIVYKIGYHKHQIEAANAYQNPDPSDTIEQAIQFHESELQKEEYASILEESTKQVEYIILN